jgi:hypothetical protein
MEGLTMNRLRLILFTLIIFGLVFNPVTASDSIDCVSRIPTLNGHIYTPMIDSYSPFISTSIRMGIGIAQTENIEYYAIRIGDYEFLSLEGNILFSDMSVQYQQRIKNWLAIFAEYHFTARIGTEFSSLFIEGINTVNEFDLGWVIKVYQHEKHIISTHFSINNVTAKFMSFENVFGNFTTDSTVAISQTIPSLIGAVGVRYVWAPNSLIGIGLLSEISYGEALTRCKTRFFFKLGPRIDIDFSSKTRIPLGIALNYYITTSPAYAQVQEKNTRLLKMKLAYIGANDFILGMSAAWGSIPVSSTDSNLNAFFGSLELNYFF